MDSNSIAVGAYCCILGGQYALAAKSCDLLVRLLDNQPEQALWSRCRADGSLLTDLSEIAQKNWRYVRVSASEPEQAYWIWAWPMNELIGIYEVSGERNILTRR